MKTGAAQKSRPLSEENIVAGYNRFKQFEGRRYTGVTIGRGHTWHYDKGTWKETKLTPDQWEFTYAVKKHRAGKAPDGSGVSVGTEYHWYILADQTVKKLNANEYATSMTGVKHKVAHKRADRGAWSATDRGRRTRMIGILQAAIAELKSEADRLPARADAPRPHDAAPRRRTLPRQRS
jgi:hypothetical protein